MLVTWKICVKSTFIDIEENCPKPQRSNSEPTLSTLKDDSIDSVWSSLDLCANEVNKMSGDRMDTSFTGEQDLPREPDPEKDGGVKGDKAGYEAGFSTGTRGHPEVCKRPCVHFVTRGCALGESCNYCHAEHTKRPVSLDKSQRRLLGKVEEKYLLEIVLGQLRSRAQVKGFYQEAERLFLILEGRLWFLHNPDLAASWSPGERQAMRRVLGKMSFAGLVGLALSKSSDESYSNDVNTALEKLRQVLPTTMEE